MTNVRACSSRLDQRERCSRIQLIRELRTTSPAGSAESEDTMPRQVFYHELEVLRERMVSMGSMVDKASARAMDALTRQDLILARDIIQNDAMINDYRWATEDEAFQVIATQAPLAGDLRVIMAVLSISTDLERMADHAVGIAKVVIETADEPPLKNLETLRDMANISRE